MTTPTPQHHPPEVLAAALKSLYLETFRLRFSLRAMPVKGPARALIDSYMDAHKPAMLEAEKLVRGMKGEP